MTKAHIFLLFVAGLLGLMLGGVVFAADTVVTDESGLMTAIISALPALVNLLPAWVGVLIGALYAIAHLIATLPTKVTAKWPRWLKTLINLLAANYGKAKNKDA